MLIANDGVSTVTNAAATAPTDADAMFFVAQSEDWNCLYWLTLPPLDWSIRPKFNQLAGVPIIARWPILLFLMLLLFLLLLSLYCRQPSTAFFCSDCSSHGSITFFTQQQPVSTLLFLWRVQKIAMVRFELIWLVNWSHCAFCIVTVCNLVICRRVKPRAKMIRSAHVQMLPVVQKRPTFLMKWPTNVSKKSLRFAHLFIRNRFS